MNPEFKEKLSTLIPLKELESSAIDQIEDALNLQFLKKLAIMPDCLDDQTEILTNSGFKLLSEIKTDTMIGSFTRKNQVLFEKPIRIIERDLRDGEEIISLDIQRLNSSLVFTEGHRHALRSNMGCTTKQLPTNLEVKDLIWGGKGLQDSEINCLSPDEIRLIAWIIGDASIRTYKIKNGLGYRIIFGLVKQRKIDRVEELCRRLNIKYSRSDYTKQTEIRLNSISSKKYAQIVGKKKTLPKQFIQIFNEIEVDIFLKEFIKVDGNYENYLKTNHMVFTSTKKENLDIISALISIHFGTSLLKNKTRDTNYKKNSTLYYLSLLEGKNTIKSKNGIHKAPINISKVNYSGKVYCITCSTGFFIARRNGRTFVTGNCHTGYHLPIGGVALLDNVISPSYVGYDIGCGMCMIITDIPADKIMSKREKIYKKIYNAIPVGFECHQENIPYKDFKTHAPVKRKEQQKLNEKVTSRLNVQLGTLGGGNHFIEIGRNKHNRIAIVIHSGSRNPGHSIGGFYMKSAKQNDTKLPGGFFEWNSEWGQAYFHDMEFMLEYALVNRKKMMLKVLKTMKLSIHLINDMVNENHNHCVLTDNGLLHRKGATPAESGQIGIIPGNMRDGTYVTCGLGNEEYLNSASHGAGRKMSRKRAAQCDLQEFKKVMHGIVAKVDKTTLDESPMAYKNLDKVIQMQEGIVVNTIDKITPIINIKG